MNNKLKKLIKTPGVFLRDYFIKRYPVVNCEQKYSELEEIAVHVVDKTINKIEYEITLDQDIDVVFTWVDNKDQKWLKKKNKNLHSNVACIDSISDARFENHNELYYSLLAIRKNMPWVRWIFIITDSQKPDWEIDDDRVKIIDHSELIDEKYLPTFNSHVIEAHLHKISGLSENFIYFNDDVFVARPLDKNHFFRKNGLASIFVADKKLSEMRRKGNITATLIASQNSNKIIEKKFGICMDMPLVHTYVPLKKSMFELCWSENRAVIELFLKNKFRGNEDLNMATFLIPWMMYLNGQAVITSEICYYFNLRSIYSLNQYDKLLMYKLCEKSPHSFCINDVNLRSKKVLNDFQHMEAFLKQYYR